MPNPNDANGSGSSTEEDKLVPLKNLQGEMSRKLAEMETKMQERLEAITQKLESFQTEPETETQEMSVDEREELRRISAAPRKYVESFVQPVKEENERLRKELNDAKSLLVKTAWDKQAERVAKKAGKGEWEELPVETQNGVINIIKEKGWGNNPNSAVDAYELYSMRKAREENSDPDRAARIAGGNTEGSGRTSGKTSTRSITRSFLDQLSGTHPKHPDYRKNMETLAKVQSGEIKIE